MTRTTTTEQLEAQNAELRARLEGAEETIRAIQHGAVDAFVLEELGRHRVYTLEGSEHPYRIFVEQMQQGVATLYADGAMLYCNRRLADLLRIPHDELVGATLRDFVDPDDRRSFDDAFVAGQTRSGRCEVRFVGRDGSTLPAHLTFNVLPSELGALIGVFVTDLTTQKEHEQLASAQEALQDADRRKDEFLAMLAHELRGPLAPLGNMLEIMKRADGNKELIQQARGTMERQLSQLVRLVDDLLDVSRITRNRLELRKERVELTSTLKRVVEASRAWTAGVEHQVTVTVPPEPIWLDADPARLTQIFYNLFHNACKYTEPTGRIWVTVEQPEGELQPPDVVVRIKDTGVGIPQDRLASIFEAFTQVDRSLERTQGGLGIGLTLVRRLVEMHGGIVTAFSAGPGQGSEFVVRLPVVSAPAEAQADPPAAPVHAPGARRFLVVDDNADSTASLAMLLSIEGHETRTARDGIEALAAAEEFHPHVVLLDIGLPKLNGYDTAKRIRLAPWGREIILIALTGWGQEEDRRKSKEAGFDGHMVKPVDFDALMKLLESLALRRAI
jgi:PAS domain S-box-containing protein